jgi:hypothetical protein
MNDMYFYKSLNRCFSTDGARNIGSLTQSAAWDEKIKIRTPIND